MNLKSIKLSPDSKVKYIVFPFIIYSRKSITMVTNQYLPRTRDGRRGLTAREGEGILEGDEIFP